MRLLRSPISAAPSVWPTGSGWPDPAPAPGLRLPSCPGDDPGTLRRSAVDNHPPPRAAPPRAAARQPTVPRFLPVCSAPRCADRGQPLPG
ncbi:hypothetical protein WR25_05728 [Diploscapter pachys]|uniref:Uncharacterized protein n=1 Tax=Diploscapter pachys TaxID=2018661 RepID=A0A2A2M674_9BILA|nr:hypothetical protein WR25_05728 [Diploscapter pachys]